MIAAFYEAGVHYDGTVTLGNLISAITFLSLAAVAWSDLRWRISNLEIWRKEHMIDADARDKLMRNSELMLGHLKTLAESERRRK